MRTSQEGIDFIKNQEGLVLNAYRCAANVLTLGYGHTYGVKETDTVTREQAENLLRFDLMEFEKAVNEVEGLKTQDQFDAMVSLAFNIGITAFKNSTLVKLFEAGRSRLAADEFLKWNHIKGKVNDGLTKRRRMERGMFLS